MITKLYQEINNLLNAIANCEVSSNDTCYQRHNDRLDMLETMLPSGSGFDSGTKIDRDKSKPDKKIVLTTSYHHMNDVGMYDGWSDHEIVITPAFHGVDIKITGRDRNNLG
jgi:hypothetical protein